MCVIVSHKRLRIPRGMSVIVYTDLSCKELRRQVAVGRVMASGHLGDVILIVSTLACNVRDVGSISALGAIFPLFIPPQHYHSGMKAVTPFD